MHATNIRLRSVNIVKWLTNYRQWSSSWSSPSSSQHKYAYQCMCVFFCLSFCLSLPFLICSFSARNELAGKKLAELVWLCVLTFWSWSRRKGRRKVVFLPLKFNSVWLQNCALHSEIDNNGTLRSMASRFVKCISLMATDMHTLYTSDQIKHAPNDIYKRLRSNLFNTIIIS